MIKFVKEKKIVVLLLVIIIALGGYFAWQKYQEKREVQEYDEFITSMTTLIVMDENADQAAIDKYYRLFEPQRDFFLENLKEPLIAFQSLMKMSLIKQTAKDYRGTEEILLYTYSIEPNSYAVTGNLGNLYYHFLEDFDQAERFYLEALDAKVIGAGGNHYTFFSELYQLYRYQLKDEQKTKDILDRGMETLPDNTGVFSLAADYYEDMGDIVKAKELYNKILEINPDHEAAQKALAELN